MQKVRRYLLVKPFLLMIPLALVVSKPIAICGKDNLPNKVQKIFAQRCLNCHGPDGQEGGLRLDSQEGVLSKLDSGATAVVPGSVDGSELMRRVVTPDETLRMPPVDKGERLTAEEIATLKSWVETGAHWNVHWSYRELVVPRPPVPQNLPWCKNEIDQFVLWQLDQAGLDPSPSADRYTLIKRLHYDLVGLPPRLEVVDEFMANESANAYEQLVDNLLRSPHFGERWGRHWLDKARYADSDGYEKDRARPNAWRFRDWVINAINQDIPFDQFSIKQLAGDLMDGASPLDQLATAFHRQTLTNTEGGTDQEEFRVKAVVDRVNTTGTVWLGLTLGCAQCHNHKYDQITQREYYKLFAFFNNGDEANAEVPVNAFISVEKARQFESEMVHLNQKLEDRRLELSRELPAFEQQLVTYLKSADLNKEPSWEIHKVESKNQVQFEQLDDGSFLAKGDNPATDKYLITGTSKLNHVGGVRVKVIADPSLPAGGPGRATNGNLVLSEVRVFAGDCEHLTSDHQIKLVSATAEFSQKNWPVQNAIDGNNKTGWAVSPKFNENHEATFLFEQPVRVDSLQGTPLYVRLTLDQQHGKEHTIGRLHAELIPFGETIPESLRRVVEMPAKTRSVTQQQQLADYSFSLDPSIIQLRNQVSQLNQKVSEALGRGKKMKVPVIVQRQEPRKTHILHRGDFLQPTEEVNCNTLAVLPLLDNDDPNRLDLAEWFFDEANPLVPRVAVNHVWSHLFGHGLVRTISDFGTRGEPPTHPQLLDWLAMKYRDLGWSRKALIKTIVMSNTYRQASVVPNDNAVDLASETNNTQTTDPENRLLARQNRRRVEAEIVRDLYLSAAGLLSTKIGGPSVFPPLPDGVMELSYANSFKWNTSTGRDRYRRGMYTFFKRTSPHPNLLTFDCPDANTTNVHRRLSNTPLAALATLNNLVFVEASQALAQRVLRIPETDTLGRMSQAVRLCITRPPSRDELDELVNLLEFSRNWYSQNMPAAEQTVGQYRPEGVPLDEAAAWVTTSRIVLNLDEFITRE